MISWLLFLGYYCSLLDFRIREFFVFGASKFSRVQNKFYRVSVLGRKLPRNNLSEKILPAESNLNLQVGGDFPRKLIS